MAGSKDPGPMCQLHKRPLWLDDGTLCRCESPRPGPVGLEPSVSDHFGSRDWGNASMGQERWFEERYPNLLEEARLKFVAAVDSWVEANWGQTPYDETSPRIAVHGRNKFESPKNAGFVWTDRKVRDDRFEKCGDKPQTFHESDAVVGSFAIDVETPVTITYTRKSVRGSDVDAYEWTAVMYVEDTLGFQAADPGAQRAPWAMRFAPSRKVKRGKWEIRGEGVRPTRFETRTHRVAPGDTLWELARKYYGDATLWPLLYKVNRDRIGANPNLLKLNSVLDVPELHEFSPGFREEAMRNAPPTEDGPRAIPVAPLL